MTTTKNKGGRPRKFGSAKTAIVYVRMTAAERDAVMQLADAREQSLSEAVRVLALAGLDAATGGAP